MTFLEFIEDGANAEAAPRSKRKEILLIIVMLRSGGVVRLPSADKEKRYEDGGGR